MGPCSRLDELQARADEAARRIAADEAEQQASVDYVARIEPRRGPSLSLTGPQSGTTLRWSCSGVLAEAGWGDVLAT